jgi:Protein of unknown function (DUF2911)/Tetratricopeptide repeat
MKALLTIALLFSAATAHAQAGLRFPQQSPAASVSQTVGITDITVTYHRPAVAGRPIWGQLVPYGAVWRAGANENTTVSFSSDVKIGGKPLRAGTYGLHMIPTAKDWTIAFSTMAMAWGSFTYDPKEDALRVTITPRPGAMEEQLLYRFDDTTDNKTTLVLAWEKLAVPISIEVDTPKVVMALVRQQLRGMGRGLWQYFNQAASYWLKNGGPLDEALKFADRSIQITPTYQNQMTRAAILEKQGNAKAAAEQRTRAQALATEDDLNQVGYQLIADKKLDEAIKQFQTIVARFPDSWNAHDSLGEALATKGDKPGAIAAYTKALSLAKDPAQKTRIEAALARLKAP